MNDNSYEPLVVVTVVAVAAAAAASSGFCEEADFDGVVGDDDGDDFVPLLG